MKGYEELPLKIKEIYKKNTLLDELEKAIESFQTWLQSCLYS